MASNKAIKFVPYGHRSCNCVARRLLRRYTTKVNDMKTKSIILNFLLLSFLLTSCDLLDQNQNVSLRLDLEKYTFFEADTLKGTFTVTNLSSNTVKYNFSTSCQYGLKIKSGSIISIQYPEVCLQVLTSLTLKSGESKLYEFQLLLVDNDYNNLIKGNYTVEAFLLNNNSSIVSKSIKIN
ncbi:MAG: hypothetical protein IH950_12100 [Bacteroidetes bacterium]|nr:hypothetical protein [Bacteroidota bacterium]